MLDPNILRIKVLEMVYEKQSGHIGGSFSIAELITVLYNDYDINGKDKLILSKGHAVPIIYAALHELGKISDADLKLFREIDSPLQGHPDKLRLPLLDATTGSLGQGLSISIGHALAKKIKKEEGFVFCILGDGEIQEGQIWEALMYAPKENLNNLICFIDYNGGQSEGSPDDIMPIYKNLYEKISSFGWHCQETDGHDQRLLRYALKTPTDRPKCIILNTIKGKGVSFIEEGRWHSSIPNEEQYTLALEELKAKL
jgi:transketolase